MSTAEHIESESGFYARRLAEMSAEVEDIHHRLRQMSQEQDLRAGRPLSVPAGILASTEAARDLLGALHLLVRGHFAGGEGQQS